MVNYQPTTLDATFAALADPTRRAILERLTRGGASVSELAEPFDMSLPAVSKHLRVLEDTGLVGRRKDGRVHRIGLRAQPLQEAAAWLKHYRRFWERRLDALVYYLQGVHLEEASSWQRQTRTRRQRSRSRERSRHPARRSSSRGHGHQR